jgi:hypothetical protein
MHEVATQDRLGSRSLRCRSIATRLVGVKLLPRTLGVAARSDLLTIFLREEIFIA